MFNSLKTKMIVPICGLLVLMVAFIVVYVSRSTRTLSGVITKERIEGTTAAAYEALSSLEGQTQSIAAAIRSNHLIISSLQNWNAGTDREGNRQALITYLESAKAEMGIDSFVIRDAEGRIVLRLHDLTAYNDIDGSPAGVAALRGQTTTSYSSTGTMPLGLNTTVPVHHEGQIIGTVTPLFFLHTNEFVDHYARLLNADVSIFAGNTRVASTILDNEGNRAIGTDAEDNVIEKVMKQGETLTTPLTIFGKPFNVNYFPLRGLNGNPIGMFFVGFSNAHTVAANNALQRDLLIISSGSVLTVALILLMLIIYTLKPIVLLKQILDEAANGDFSKRLPEKGNDETAQASRSFNKTMMGIGKMIGSIKRQTGNLSEIGDNLTNNMTNTAAAMNQIAANIQTIKGRILNQSASVTQTSASMEKINGYIGKLNDQVESQTDAISQSSSAIEEMLANIQSVNTTLAKNASNVNELQKSSNAGKTSLQEVVANIQEIARDSEGLLEINSVMENISSQTNLLSMNAAIEAAHAGESGKGFAVVAGEIRKLAESSSKQSQIIGEVLRKIKVSIDKSTRSTENVLNRFDVITRMVQTVAQQEEVLRSAMEEQTEGSNQMLMTSEHVNEITQQVKHGSIEMLEGGKEVVHESKNLEKATYEITNGMNEISNGTEQVNSAVHSVNDLSKKTQSSISSLVMAISQFKV